MGKALEGQGRASNVSQRSTQGLGSSGPRAANGPPIPKARPELARVSDDRGSQQGVRVEVVEILADAIFLLILEGQALAVRHEEP